MSYPYTFENVFSKSVGFNPIKAYTSEGIDFSTGKRNVPYSIQNLVEKKEEALPPAFGTPGEGTSVEDYKKFNQQLVGDLTKYELLSNAMNVGAGTLASAAMLPFVKDLRKTDFELGLQADVLSPTKQAQRNLALQQQLGTPVIDMMNALAQTRQAVKFRG
jgi:hypothetical protein